jgi:D-3-phosphoglycerate dehydrogenase
VNEPVVALLGTRYPDLSIEEEVLGDIARITAGTGATPAEIVAVAGSARVIVAGSLPRFTPDVLEQMSCRAIVRAGIGVDSVDLESARSLGYVVAYVPDYGTEAVAQHTLALALAATRRLVEADAIVRSGAWGFADLRPLHLPSTMTAGVVGFGRIGRRVAELLLAVGFRRVLVHDAYLTPDMAGVEVGGLEQVFGESDLVTLHAPGPPDGRHLVGRPELESMKPESILINTARGSLVDHEALAEALEAGVPRLAALDVFQPEPPDLSRFGAVLDRMILSPHTGWYTEESQADLRRKSAEEARRIILGESPHHAAVLPEETT